MVSMYSHMFRRAHILLICNLEYTNGKKRNTFYHLVVMLCVWNQKLVFLLSGQFLNFPHYVMSAYALSSARRHKAINDLSTHLGDVTKHFRNCRQFKEQPASRHLSLFQQREETGFICRAHHVQWTLGAN